MAKLEQWRKGRDRIRYRKCKTAAWALGLGSLVVSIWYLFVPHWAIYLLCIGFVLTPLVLDIVMPEYFTLFFVGGGKKAEARELLWPIFAHVLMMSFLPGSNWIQENLFWVVAGISGGLVTLLLGLFAREFRGKKGALAIAFFLSGVIGSLMVGQINETMDFAPRDSYVLKVEELREDNGRNPSRKCMVTLPETGEIWLNISWGLYENLEVGDIIRVEVGKGALGIEYANAYPVE